MKLLTIVTALKNSDREILETYKSTLPKLPPTVEWIIKNSEYTASSEVQCMADGASIKVVNRKDKSLYDALNQAIQHSEGKYLWVVGAGDKFIEGAIVKVLEVIKVVETENMADSICFPIYHRLLQRIIATNPTKFGPHMTCPHPGTIVKTENVKAIGGFDDRLEIAADYDLLLKYFNKWTRVVVVPSPIIDFKGGGISELRGEEARLEVELVNARRLKAH